MVERKREIGICIAIGATEIDVLWCFIFETVIISFIGGVIGTCIGNVITCLVFNVIKIPYKFDFLNFISASLIAVFIGILSSVIPATKAAKLEPIEALKN